MLLYYITDRKGLAGTDAQQRSRLLVRIGEAAHAGVDYIQLREKDLAARDLERLAREAVRTVREHSATAKLLINGRTDVALASGADGVHLPAGELDASDVRALWMQASDRAPVIAVSAHTIQEVRAAAADGANFAVLAPIFEKAHTGVQGIGIDALRAACASTLPAEFAILALGGVTLANARACLAAGTAGVAGIRLFQNGDIVETVRRLRELEHI
ncbi:MAG: thiamine phosphate synthase [Candidatus Korobacteraceae bacterium]|jgi:thiamine-phosphate pyrophosphorylase